MSASPRTDDEVWVVNEVSDSISIVSISQHMVTDTIYVPDEPADVVFANGRAFVTSARKNQIRVFDAVTHASITNIPVFGENPRAIVANASGTKVYAAFALSGNRTTLVPPDKAPQQPTNAVPPMNTNLPAPPQVSLIVDATDPAWTNGANAPIKFTMPDNDVVEIDTASLAITRYFSRVGTVNLGLAVRPGSGDLYVASTDARNLTRFEPNLRSAFTTNQVSRINITNGAVTRFDLNPGFNYTNFPSLPDKTNALAQPTAIVFEPGGTNFYVAAFGSDRVALVDANNGSVTARIELHPTAIGSAADPRTKRGPRGLALKTGQALYVLNRLANSISVINPATRAVLREIPVGSFDPTTPEIRDGRGFLYDARVSGNGTVSCASCHIDAEMDLLAWDLGDPQGDLAIVNAKVSGTGGLISSNFVMHPMKGPMTTQTLRGLKGLDPLHWRGDRTNFMHFRGAFDGLLGGSLLSVADMQAYTNFINTIIFQPNPNRNLDRSLPTSFAGGNPVLGEQLYMGTNYTINLRCNVCHAVPNGTDKSFTPAAALQESQTFKVPQLRSVYQKMTFTNAPGAQSIAGFGIVHDGSDPSLFAFLSRPVFGTFSGNSTIKLNIGAFVQCFDSGTAQAVGYARTLTPANVNITSVSNDWSLLEAQAAVLTNINLIVKGTIDGSRRGLLYRTDKTGVGPFTRAQQRAKILAGDKLTVMGVPPGSGYRMGIDRNQDGVLDGDIAAPGLEVARTNSVAVVSWLTNAGGFLLERTDKLPSTNWLPDTNVRGTNANKINVTNAVANSNLFFRLREL